MADTNSTYAILPRLRHREVRCLLTWPLIMPIYVVDKPLGLTSHDVVASARRSLKTRRVGHTGTLDPLATGVLVLCVEGSTKLVQFMERDSKDYLAWVSLGAATVTLDAEGPISEVAEVNVPSSKQIMTMLSGFIGSQKQIPPQYSALQVGGQRAYAVARAGGALDLPARDIIIHKLELLGVYPSVQAAPRTFDPATWEPAAMGLTFTLPAPLGEFPTLLLRSSMGSGTYLRSLARDIGAALGVPAHLAGLVRTRAGQFDLGQAVALSELHPAAGLDDLGALAMPTLNVDEATARELRQGKRPTHTHMGRAAVLHSGQLVAVVDGDGQRLKVVRVWQ